LFQEFEDREDRKECKCKVTGVVGKFSDWNMVEFVKLFVENDL